MVAAVGLLFRKRERAVALFGIEGDDEVGHVIGAVWIDLVEIERRKYRFTSVAAEHSYRFRTGNRLLIKG